MIAQYLSRKVKVFRFKQIFYPWSFFLKPIILSITILSILDIKIFLFELQFLCLRIWYLGIRLLPNLEVLKHSRTRLSNFNLILLVYLIAVIGAKIANIIESLARRLLLHIDSRNLEYSLSLIMFQAIRFILWTWVNLTRRFCISIWGWLSFI